MTWVVVAWRNEGLRNVFESCWYFDADALGSSSSDEEYSELLSDNGCCFILAGGKRAWLE
jgi:hypothetical protein